jgi:hypothetical protein
MVGVMVGVMVGDDSVGCGLFGFVVGALVEFSPRVSTISRKRKKMEVFITTTRNISDTLIGACVTLVSDFANFEFVIFSVLVIDARDLFAVSN